MTTFWMSLRNASGGAFLATPRRSTSYLAWDGDRPPTPADAVGSGSNWGKQVIREAGVDGDIVFFVHGYNNTVETVHARHRLLQDGLAKAGFPCVVVSFDWPSGSDTLAYLPDRHNAKQTALALVADGIGLFTRLSTPDCDINLHVVAHSMGGLLVREAFDDADDTQLKSSSWMIGQLALVAADLSSASLSEGKDSTESLYRHAYRITNYHCGYDEALQISNAKRIGLAPRVGRVGLPEDAPTKAIDVDCSAYFGARRKILVDRVGDQGDPTHSWYFWDGGFLQDLATTLRGSRDRGVIPNRTEIVRGRYRLNPPA